MRMTDAAEQTGNKGDVIVTASTYAQGVAKLRAAGEQPKTFKQNIEARVVAYENGDHELFDAWLDSCTGIAYEAGTTKFKIIPKCNDLITIPEGFNQYFLPVVYSAVSGAQLNSQKGKYNQLLKKGEVLKHRGWLASVEDKPLLKAYCDIVFNELKTKYGRDAGMSFYVKQNTATDELRALFVSSLINFSFAFGDYDLSSGGSFLLGSPVVVRAAGARTENSSFHQPATPCQEVLDDKILDALSVFDQFKSGATEKSYLRAQKKAFKQLKGLY